MLADDCRALEAAPRPVAALTIAYAAAAGALVTSPGPARPEVVDGLALLWRPGVILLLEGLGLAMFAFTGRSVVTAATISIRVVRERI